MKRFFPCLTLAALMLTATIPAVAAESAGTASASVGLSSLYVWRGQQLSGGVVLQPSAGLTYGPVGFSLWSNYDIDNETLNETDVTLSYSRAAGPLSLQAGLIHYGLEGLADTQEIYLTVGAATILSPSLTLFYDFGEGDGAYLQAAISHAFPVSDTFQVKVGASAGYTLGNSLMGADAAGDALSCLYSAEIWVSAPLTVGPAVIEPRIAYSTSLSDKAKTALEGISPDGDASPLYGGVTVTFAL
jgi:hypothetical protein